ncbi:MAG TPA: prepilin peptidase [Myxococcota bacterium]|nr:prepilin peptidase [Myxococcota bacterium]
MLANSLIQGLSSILAVLMAFLGACFGSFASLIIYRLPREQSIVWPRSHCDSCQKPLLKRHNIPIFSWLILRGRCFFCRAPLGQRSLIIELIMGVCLLSLYLKMGLSIALVDKFSFFFLLVCLAYIDLDTFTLPLVILLSLMFLGLGFSLIYLAYPHLYVPLGKQIGVLKIMVFNETPKFSISDRIFGSGFGFLFLSAVNILATAIFRKMGRLSSAQWAMGWGDPLLVLALGLFVGLSHLILLLFLASLLGSLMGIASRPWSYDSGCGDEIAKGALPFGPFLALAAIYIYLA